ncbi:MAG: PAS domain-containing sensor histidine kinase [Saprospirales bacterium]|nr:PAS domain-containing sensor histidine kinase [Saprospirales bacterium]
MDHKLPENQASDVALRLQAVIETVIDGIITIDDKGIIETVNPAAARLFGYEPEEIVGKNIKNLMPSPYRQQHDGYIERYKSSGEAKIIGTGREVTGMRKDGSTFPMRLAVSEVLLEERRIFTGIIHDLSDVKQAEEKIRKLNEELEEKVIERTEELASVVNKLLNTNKKLQYEVQERKSAENALRESTLEIQKALEKEKELSELKSRFVSMASHEFRTPLSTILSSISLLSRYTETSQQDKRDKHINRIKSSVRNLTGILNDFLSLSKLEEGKIENLPSEFDIGELCPEVIDEIQGLLKDGQEIVHEGLGSPLFVRWDKRLVKNILFNLLSNAIKYSDEGKKIFMKERLEEDFFLIDIIDKGIGIPDADQPYLFTRFFRAANATNIQGTGLGLNIVKRYIDLVGGSITFESQLNEGTIFTVCLPLLQKSL